jgi:hypothetical protein
MPARNNILDEYLGQRRHVSRERSRLDKEWLCLEKQHLESGQAVCRVIHGPRFRGSGVYDMLCQEHE